MENEKENQLLQEERKSLLIGMMLGQISELLNYIKREEANLGATYKALFDIHQMAALQVHEIYYLGNTENKNDK